MSRNEAEETVSFMEELKSMTMDINYWLQQHKINDGFSVIRNYEV
jgi:hypothetical protein